VSAEVKSSRRDEPDDDQQLIEPVLFDFGVTRRSFVQVLGAGVVISATLPSALAQRRGGGGRGRGGPPPNVGARIHIGKDGVITVLAGKTEMGQGARAQLTQAAAEELRVPVQRIRMLMADTSLVPNDGNTAGSRTTPSTVPSVQAAAAAARELLVLHASAHWNVSADAIEIRDGQIVHAISGRSLGYGEIAQEEELLQKFAATVPENVTLTAVGQWKVLGSSYASPNHRDMVTGEHKYPSDHSRPGMLYGAILRPPTYGATLESIDLAPADAIDGVIVVRDGQFVGVAAPTSQQARQAIEVLAARAQWKKESQPSSKNLYDYLREHAERVPENPFKEQFDGAEKKLRQTYHVAYVQHAPMEPRVALAEWSGGKLTVWAGTQNPFGYRGELAGAFRLPEDSVRVVVPDFGGGFGGKHTGEAAIEAARLARGAGKPVLLRWTREEEFTWAYFRPAGIIDCEACLDGQNQISSWYFVNINSGGSAIDTPYDVAKNQSRSVSSRAPLRQGSYRALASTANTFARESIMDELAAEVGVDPLEFRLTHLRPGRLRDVLEEAARQFRWPERVKAKQPNVGVGIACGTEKGSYVATCAEVEVDRSQNQIRVRHVCTAYECGAIMNPDNLRSQVEGAIIMGLGPALQEEMRFEGGTMENATFRRYRVPHFRDVPTLEIHLLNRPDLPSVGAGETPLIGIAPAIGNAVYHATGIRIRQMPMRLPDREES
jgi:isoquinoline 1-oxidoreductase